MKTSALRYSRRDMLRVSSATTLGAVISEHWWASGASAQDETRPSPLNRFPRMLQEYYVDRLHAFRQERLERLDSLTSKEDAEKYVESCRERIRQSFGPEPERTPLNARITGTVERDGYRIEKLIFESRPGFLVTANLYLPTNVEGRRPGVIGTCGHSHNGKAAEAYQAFSQGLARKGFVCLIYDPIGQGERFQYVDEDRGSHVGAGVREHLLAGNQQYLVGEFFGMWRAWDGIRALDYLLTRDEVDPEQIGVTGNSGGGTMTTWLCGLENRWTMAAPACFVTTFVRNLENELPADTEQCPPSALALGLEHEDFIAAMAPRPVIILAKEKDYFDVRGSEAAFGRLRRLYSLLGAEENIELFVGPSYHGYSQENREAMYGWFNRATGSSQEPAEPELTMEDDQTLWCTPRGQVDAIGSRPVFSFTSQLAQRLKEHRDVDATDLRRAVRDLTKSDGRLSHGRVRILRPRSNRGYPRPHFATYAVETDPGVHALVYRLYDERHYSRPPGSDQQAFLYVSHHSSDVELRENGKLRELIEAERHLPVYTLDVRGIGESRPDTTNADSFLSPYGSDYFYAAHGIMLDDPMPLQRVRDILAVVDWITGSVGHPGVHLFASGWGTVPATLAAIISPEVRQVTLQHALTSYTELATVEKYTWPLSSMIPGILQSFDLPDCYRLLEDRGLTQIEPWGPTDS